ncbi:hypothetical protein [Tepidanaerobacter acetatoxydans]|uniref:hypothetical protein n=1 Tax=Tepidanaerobacter acetatoxydans TaxID=499229 RepID=UPI001BD42DD3|nr:hypothetical protein [Tepidanaerobacter acetatoxydans]
MDEDKEYLVPRAVRSRMEFFPGFGVPEIAAVGAGGAIGFLLQYLFSFSPFPTGVKPFIKIVTLTLCTGVPYMAVKQDAFGTSLYTQLKAFKKWNSRPKKYLYVLSRRLEK